MLTRGSVAASLACLAALAGYVLLFPPTRIQGTQLDTCPMVLAGLPGTKLTMEQTVLDNLDPDDYLLRSYTRPDGSPVWVVIVYFQNARLGAHDPELCYRSSGFRVHPLPGGKVESAIGPVPYLSFLAEKGSRSELVDYFWYTSGGQFLSEVKAWRDRMFFHGLRSNRSFGAFVRVSTLTGTDLPAAGEAVLRVTEDLAPRLPGFFPEGAKKQEGGR
jgi:EpsI family protein